MRGLTCQIEIDWERESVLCGQPAVVRINRFEHGKLSVCLKHMTHELYDEAVANDWAWTVLIPTDRPVELAAW